MSQSNAAKVNPVSYDVPSEFVWIKDLPKEQVELLNLVMKLKGEHRSQASAMEQMKKDEENRLREAKKDEKEARAHKLGMSKFIGTAIMVLILLFGLGTANMFTSTKRFEQNVGMTQKEFRNDVQTRYAANRQAWVDSLQSAPGK